MTQLLQAPRDLSPMWQDLAHVIACAPTRVIVRPAVARCSTGRAAALALVPLNDPWPARRRRIPVLAMLLAQAGCAALTAGMLLLMGLGPG